jgi:hypothetical protein
MAKGDRSARQVLRNKLKARAYTILAVLKEPLASPLTVRAADRSHQVTVTVALAGQTADTPPEAQGGLFLSPLEAAIVNALDHETWLIGKQIGKRVSQPYTGRLRGIVYNLIERRILCKNPEGQGYRLHEGFRPAARKKPAS